LRAVVEADVWLLVPVQEDQTHTEEARERMLVPHQLVEMQLQILELVEVEVETAAALPEPAVMVVQALCRLVS
jgi:hypothetical protein